MATITVHPFPGAYVLFAAGGFLAATAMVLWAGRREGRPLERNLRDTGVGGVIALAGAKGAELALHWSRHTADGEAFREFLRSGMVAVGGVAAVAAWLVMRDLRRPRRMLVSLDMGAVALFACQAVTRWACWFSGCCHGVVLEADRWWAVRYQADPALHGSARELLDPGGLTPPLFPAPAAFSLAWLALLPVVIVVFARKRWDGQAFCAAIGLYGLARFGLEFLRGDDLRGFLWGLSTSQWASIGLIAVACATALWARRLGPPLRAGGPAEA